MHDQEYETGMTGHRSVAYLLCVPTSSGRDWCACLPWELSLRAAGDVSVLGSALQSIP